jgi:hypothetical protein
MTERHSHVVAGLIAKRRELAGVIADLERQLAQHRADLTHIDGVLRVLAANLDLESIKPKRIYRRSLYFARNELSRLVLASLRIAMKPLSVDDLTHQAMITKGFNPTDAILRAAIRDQVGAIVKRLRRQNIAESIGQRRATRWKLGDPQSSSTTD